MTLEVDREVDNVSTDSTASILTAGMLGEKYIGISVGGEQEMLREGGEIGDTQSALVLEGLSGEFLLNTGNKEGQ